MRSKLISALTVIGAVTILLLAGNTVALAATGKGFLLGKTNTTSKATTLKRTAPGAALKITTKKTTDAPIKVNGTGRVANLNADKIDGLDSSALVNTARTYSLPTIAATNRFSVALSSLPGGLYHANFSATFSLASGSTGANCYFELNNVTALLTYGAKSDTFSAVTGGGIIDTRGKTLEFTCFTGAGTITPTSPATQLSFVPLSSVTAGGAATPSTRSVAPRVGAAR